LTKKTINCGNCGAENNEGSVVCRKCGSTHQRVNWNVKDILSPNVIELASGWAKEKGQKKPVYEFKKGSEIFRNTSELRHIEREIDRRDELNKTYKEKIIDQKTGRLIKEVFEPLSGHRGHGSAKKKKIERPKE